MKSTSSYMFDAIKKTDGDIAATLAILSRTSPAGHRCILATVKKLTSFGGHRLVFRKSGLVQVVANETVAA